ncbi:MAG: EF-P lysine aminoacylase EpmA [Gammaproteobacteria bacterium]|nr:EF-P lysine aminoacylase EpmA [Gammaproteobacteria bacterium]
MPDYCPSPSYRELLQRRATMYAQIRQFFAERNVLEVETPIFSESGNTDPAISSVIADFSYASEKRSDIRYAHTSPEFPMKRLLANGSGAIYQICKVFRKEESGRLHNPEFSMLEWYRPGLKYHQLMDEITELLKMLGVASAVERVSYAELFQLHLKLDVLNASVDDLKNCARKSGLDVVGFDDDYDAWSSMLLANLIEPELGKDKPFFVYDYPLSQAALANTCEENNVAERFELYINGVEIANGYQELTDAEVYRCRFEQDNKKRKASGLPEIKIDMRLLNDLKSGFPDSSGVALGLDRLLMAITGAVRISDVLSFDFHNI